MCAISGRDLKLYKNNRWLGGRTQSDGGLVTFAYGTSSQLKRGIKCVTFWLKSCDSISVNEVIMARLQGRGSLGCLTQARTLHSAQPRNRRRLLLSNGALLSTCLIMIAASFYAVPAAWAQSP